MTDRSAASPFPNRKTAADVHPGGEPNITRHTGIPGNGRAGEVARQ
jgi:hypothetical protein